MDENVDWRQRYLDIANLQEREAEAHTETQRELNRLIARLCVAVSGLDPVLDPHLERLRAVAKGSDSGPVLKQAGEISTALMRAPGGRGRRGILPRLLEHMSLEPGQRDEILRLWAELADDPVNATDAQLDRLVDLLQSGGADLEPHQAKPGLLARLIGRGEQEVGSEPNRLLLDLLQAVDWPNSLQKDVEVFRSELTADGRGDAWIDVVRQISDLVVGVMGRAQVEARSAESFLTGLNQRLEELDEHMLIEVSRREDSRVSSELFGRKMDTEVVDLSASLRDSINLAELQSSVIGSLERMRTHVRTHIDEEAERREKAEAEATRLRKQLHRIEEDSFDLRRQVAQTYQEAMCDPLTGLPNRRAYDERVAQEYARWKRFADPLALLIWDVDDFKRVNDTFGHASGDKALAMIGKTLRDRVRETDFISRYGGEEFVMLLIGAEQDQALRLAENLRLEIESSGMHANGEPVKVTLSGGLSLFCDGDQIEQVFERADGAMYKAKRQGKNCVVVA